MPDLWMDVDTALSEVPVNKVQLIDDTDFKTREESVTYDQAGMDLVWNFKTTAGVFTQTAVTPTTAGDYDWANQLNGFYTIEIPASGGASINNDTEGFGSFAGYATGILAWIGPTIGFRDSDLNNELIDGAYNAARGLAGTNLDQAISALNDFDPANDDVAVVTLNTDMRGTDGANTVVPDAAGVVPTAIENRQEMDSNSTRLAAIEADTTGINGDAMRGTDDAALAIELAKVPKSDGSATWNSTALGSINTQVDLALNTAIPGSPTATSINDYMKRAKFAVCNRWDIDEATGDLDVYDDSNSLFLATAAAFTTLAGVTLRKKIL